MTDEQKGNKKTVFIKSLSYGCLGIIKYKERVKEQKISWCTIEDKETVWNQWESGT